MDEHICSLVSDNSWYSSVWALANLAISRLLLSLQKRYHGDGDGPQVILRLNSFNVPPPIPDAEYIHLNAKPLQRRGGDELAKLRTMSERRPRAPVRTHHSRRSFPDTADRTSRVQSEFIPGAAGPGQPVVVRVDGSVTFFWKMQRALVSLIGPSRRQANSPNGLPPYPEDARLSPFPYNPPAYTYHVQRSVEVHRPSTIYDLEPRTVEIVPLSSVSSRSGSALGWVDSEPRSQTLSRSNTVNIATPADMPTELTQPPTAAPTAIADPFLLPSPYSEHSSLFSWNPFSRVNHERALSTVLHRSDTLLPDSEEPAANMGGVSLSTAAGGGEQLGGFSTFDSHPLQERRPKPLPPVPTSPVRTP